LETVTSKYEISYEILSSSDSVRWFFVNNPKKWFTKEDVLAFLEEKEKKLAVGTLYNLFSTLKRIGFLESRRSSFALYRLADIKNEIHPIGGVSLGVKPRLFKLDFFRYLETLAWEDVRRVHDVHLWVSIGSWGFVDSEWENHVRRKCFVRRVVVDGLRFELRVNYGVGSLSVIVKCANEPVAVGFEGLTSLFSVLSSVRGKYCPGVPSVAEWTVKEWHFGRDTKGGISGLDFDVSFKDWFGNLVRVYSRHDKKARIERVENPNVKVAKLLGHEEVEGVPRGTLTPRHLKALAWSSQSASKQDQKLEIHCLVGNVVVDS